MTSQEYQTLSEKIDKLAEKFDSQMLPRNEYDKAHEALQYRVQLLEQKIESWAVSGRAEINRIETSNGTKYDKLDARISGLDTKIDGLKDNMVLRFENQNNQQTTNRRSTTQWIISLIISSLGSGGLGAIIVYLLHLGH